MNKNLPVCTGQKMFYIFDSSLPFRAFITFFFQLVCDVATYVSMMYVHAESYQKGTGSFTFQIHFSDSSNSVRLGFLGLIKAKAYWFENRSINLIKTPTYLCVCVVCVIHKN